ncbi:MAG: hypothetical protein NUV49_03595 [Patescibacteria group bacterium]|nr:hypothetical protein [Patescibacteria group bacterium]
MTSREYNERGNKQYWATFQGSFRRKAQDNDNQDEVITRINKNDKEVHEISRTALSGYIADIYFEPSDFGEQLKIELDASEDGKIPVLGFGVESKDGRDLLKKLPAIDLAKEVKFIPYQFTDDGDTRSGITLYQSDTGEFDKKIANFFWDDEKKEAVNGFPPIDWDNATEKEQKMWKIERDSFLKTYLQENVLPKFQVKPAEPEEEPEEDISPSDGPF